MVNRGARTFPRNSKGIVFVDEPGDEVVVTSCPARFASYMCRSIFTAELRPPRQYCDGRVGSGIPSASVARMTAICNAGAASRHVTGMSESDEVQMITEDRWTEAVIGSAALLTDADLKAMNLTAGFDDLWASVLALGSADLTRPALPRQLSRPLLPSRGSSLRLGEPQRRPECPSEAPVELSQASLASRVSPRMTPARP
jgi:hypothetical protein